MVSTETTGEGWWSDAHPVRTLLRQRRDSGYTAGGPGDGCKLGLAVEGGGMRGIVSAAMLNALEDLGYADAFDEMYACSAGAINAAYFAMRQTWYPLSIYFDDLTDGVFLDFRRMLRRRGPMDLDYLFDDVLTRRKPLDYAVVVRAPQKLHVMVTDVDEMRALDVDAFSSPEDLRDALRATTWLPLATVGTTPFRGHRAVDGGVLWPHPYQAAVQDGCTHVLSLSTKPAGRPSTARLSPSDRLVGHVLNKEQPGLGSRFLSLRTDYQRRDRPFLIRARRDTEARPAILDLAPWPGNPEVKRHEVDRGRLLDGARSAYRTVLRILDGEDVQVIPRLVAHRATVGKAE